MPLNRKAKALKAAMFAEIEIPREAVSTETSAGAPTSVGAIEQILNKEYISWDDLLVLGADADDISKADALGIEPRIVRDYYKKTGTLDIEKAAIDYWEAEIFKLKKKIEALKKPEKTVVAEVENEV